MWRDSSRRPRFFGIEVYALFPIMIFLFHIRLWTFVLACVCVFGLFLIERRQIDAVVALRILRSWFTGRVRPVVPWGRRRRF